MKKIMLLIAVLALSACTPLEGNFKAEKDLTFKSKKSIFSSKYISVRVPARDYKAKFNFTNFNNLKIDLSGVDKTIKIKMPDGLNINPKDDEFFIQGSDINQIYDFDGRIQSHYTRTNTRRERESCSYTRYEQRCGTVCYVDNWGQQICRVECSQMPVTYWGTRIVEYYHSTRNTEMRLEVLEPSTSEPVGLFNGDEVRTSRIVTFESMCR